MAGEEAICSEDGSGIAGETDVGAVQGGLPGEGGGGAGEVRSQARARVWTLRCGGKGHTPLCTERRWKARVHGRVNRRLGGREKLQKLRTFPPREMRPGGQLRTEKGGSACRPKGKRKHHLGGWERTFPERRGAQRETQTLDLTMRPVSTEPASPAATLVLGRVHV